MVFRSFPEGTIPWFSPFLQYYPEGMSVAAFRAATMHGIRLELHVVIVDAGPGKDVALHRDYVLLWLGRFLRNVWIREAVQRGHAYLVDVVPHNRKLHRLYCPEFMPLRYVVPEEIILGHFPSINIFRSYPFCNFFRI